jgi:hypothetical protein
MQWYKVEWYANPDALKQNELRIVYVKDKSLVHAMSRWQRAQGVPAQAVLEKIVAASAEDAAWVERLLGHPTYWFHHVPQQHVKNRSQ